MAFFSRVINHFVYELCMVSTVTLARRNDKTCITSILLHPDHRREHYKMRRGVCPSVTLSCARPNSRKKRPRKPKLGRMEAYHTRNPWTYLEVKRSTVKVTRPINQINGNSRDAEVKVKVYSIKQITKPYAQVGGITSLHYVYTVGYGEER